MSEIKVEVGQYRLVDKGSLKGTFSLVIYPEGQKILDCKYFVMDGKRWIAFPAKEIKHTDGRKTEYIPYISYLNKEYLEKLKSAVLEALLTAQPQESYGKEKSTKAQYTKSSVSRQSPSDDEDLPF